MTQKQQRPASKQQVSSATIWVAVIASTLVPVLLYFGLLWAADPGPTVTVSETTSSQQELSTNGLLVIGLIAGAFVLGPGILAALIVLPIIRKNKKKT